MNRPQVVYFLSGVLAYFPSGARTGLVNSFQLLDDVLVSSLTRFLGGIACDDEFLRQGEPARSPIRWSGPVTTVGLRFFH